VDEMGRSNGYGLNSKKGDMMYKVLVVFEKTKTGYSAYSPDLPGLK